MSKGPIVDEDEEKAILEALKAGRSVRDIAAEFSRGKSTVGNIASRNGLDLMDVHRTKKAAIAKSCYASIERIELVGLLLNKAKQLMKTCDSSRDLQYLATSIAIGIDKRRLEESTDPAGRGGELRTLFEKMETDGAGGSAEISDPLGGENQGGDN